MTSLREAVRGATHVLAEAGVASAPVDALVLAAHALGVEVSEARRLLIVGGVEVPPEYAALVAERARRVPLQHLTGEAHFRGLTLRVGPGVFVPRPETETLVSLALVAIDAVGSDGAGDPVGPVDRATPVGAGGADGPATVVDLCTGSGAIAFSLKAERPDLDVRAIEADPLAHAWAVANRDRLGLDVQVDLGDARTAYPELVGTVDVVTCNPPYIPDDQVPVDPEVRDHDPALALYGGSADGLALPLAMAARAAALLRPRGVLVMEHADVQGPAILRALAATGSWRDAADHADLTGRPRVVVARR
ncbi:MAG: Release factor glutamine methyltransferase [bacterium ADurb.BinA028]|jgi:release factor glutamine methyltransferase|nr:MAG: Release factor glutamine methyltransferase [bacterium ADurb.BinA028]HNV14643.1 peptide chain release factor N(5)-glutamine methyltransferase [Dermatophilaceae bacterium]